jgi:O-antigen/teichoic acid export membrane protein
VDRKNLLKGTLVYSLSNVITKAGSIVFLPIMTRILTVDEYGIIGTLAPVTTFLTVILGLGIYNAQMKQYVVLKDDKKELGSYLFSSNFILIIINVLFLLFLLMPVSEVIFSKIPGLDKITYSPYVILSAAIATVNVFNILAIRFFRMQKKYTQVALGSLLSFFSNYMLAIFFISRLKLGVTGYLAANLAAVLLLFLYYAKGYFMNFRIPVKMKYIKYSLKNGIPLVFIELTDQVVNLSDRLLLLMFLDFKTVGYYTLAYTGGRVLSMVTGSFIDSWTPEFYEIMSSDREDKNVTDILEEFIAVLTVVCVLAQVFSPELITMIFPAKFYNAIEFMPIILPAVVIQAFYCLDYFFHFHEESWYIIFLTLFCMIFNLVFNFLLIPVFGALTAAWTTLAAFFLRAVLEMILIKRKYKVGFHYKKLILYLIIMVNPLIMYLGSSHISILKFLMKIVYVLIVLKLVVNKRVYKKILAILNKVRRKFQK